MAQVTYGTQLAKICFKFIYIRNIKTVNIYTSSRNSSVCGNSHLRKRTYTATQPSRSAGLLGTITSAFFYSGREDWARCCVRKTKVKLFLPQKVPRDPSQLTLIFLRKFGNIVSAPSIFIYQIWLPMQSKQYLRFFILDANAAIYV